MTIEQQLTEIRLSKGLNKSDFARLTGVHVSTVTQYERGEIKISKMTADKINKVFGTSFKVKFTCKSCKKVLEQTNPRHKYCPNCIGKVKYKYPKKEGLGRFKTSLSQASLTQADKQSKNLGISYGEMVAQQYGGGRIASKIKNVGV